ncbi:MAG TPA: rhodanese-like domain-containing protein [Candidatus Polarisedimenticolaceae bacterium]|nr:rhodanese-like domain-containing protein [Candidatus Polarisedimenticolaceae bacterium]
MARHPHASIDPPSQSLGRGIAGIVLTGALLGLGFNHLALQGPPPHRGLAWISEPKVFQDVETLLAQQARPPREPVPESSASPAMTAPAPRPAPEQAPKTAAAAATPAAPEAPKQAEQAQPQAPAPSALDVPDTGRPLMVQLPKVKEFWDAKAALIVDARDPAEFAQGHIPGAVNIPADEAISDPDRLEAVDSGGRPIICYCGGGTCEVSIHLAEALVYQAGKKRVLVFMGGWPDWEGAGYPVEK